MQTDQNQQQNEAVKSKPFFIGIIYNGFNADDIASYKQALIEVQKEYGPDKVCFIVFGYEPEQDKTQMLEGLEFYDVQKVSLIHWFKQLEYVKLDLLFIPLINDVFNNTSETEAKYLEASIFDVPVLAPATGIYQELITDQYNGFLYDPANLKETLLSLLKMDYTSLKHCGRVAYERVKQKHTFTPENIQFLKRSIIAEEE